MEMLYLRSVGPSVPFLRERKHVNEFESPRMSTIHCTVFEMFKNSIWVNEHFKYLQFESQ